MPCFPLVERRGALAPSVVETPYPSPLVEQRGALAPSFVETPAPQGLSRA